MRLPPRPVLTWFAAAMALAGAAVLVLAIGDGYGLPFLASRGPADHVQGLAGAPSDPAASSTELTVFDESRDLPEIHFSNAAGRELTLADFRGKIVLLNIWATWCMPCRKEMPALDRLQAQLGGNDFQVLPLSIDRNGVTAVKRFYGELGVQKLAIYLDPAVAAPRALGAAGVPATVLIERDGRESARKMGAAGWDSPEMIALFRRRIEARPTPKKGAQQ